MNASPETVIHTLTQKLASAVTEAAFALAAAQDLEKRVEELEGQVGDLSEKLWAATGSEGD